MTLQRRIVIRNVHATFQHQFLDLAQAQVEPDVEPDNMSDDLRRKPVAFVADLLCLHRHRPRPGQRTSNLRPVNVTTPHGKHHLGRFAL